MATVTNIRSMLASAAVQIESMGGIPSVGRVTKENDTQELREAAQQLGMTVEVVLSHSDSKAQRLRPIIKLNSKGA